MAELFLPAAHWLCAIAYGALALLLVLHGRSRGLTSLVVAAAPAATAAWALSRVLGVSPLPQTDFAQLGILEAAPTLAWILLLAMAYRVGLPAGEADRRTLGVALGSGAVVAWLLALRWGGDAVGLGPGAVFAASAWGWLVLPALGLFLAEALLRQARAESLWRVKFLCVGVGGILAYDLFLTSEALLFRRWDPVLTQARGVISLLALPLVAIAAARNPAWSVQLNLSRRAVTHSVVLVGIGIYLLLVAAGGVVLSRWEGAGPGILQAAFLFLAIVFLALLYFSSTVRSFARHGLGRYLFTHRHDYREQWKSFSRTLSSREAGMTLRERALAAVASVFDSPVGGLWLRDQELFHLEANQRLPESCADVAADSALVAALESDPGRVLELPASEEERPPWLPDWLRSWRLAWLVAPLVHQAELIGFIVLIRTWPGRTLHPEDEELLEVVSSQAASYLVEEQVTRALGEARRFEEISKGTAFIAHDLRNLANSVDLMLDNARKHIHEPPFQEDLLFSLRESVDRMKRLLGRLGESRQQTSPGERSDLVEIVKASSATRFSPQISLQVEDLASGSLPVAADADRLVAITGHLIQNALDAVGAEGHVRVRVAREGGEAIFEVLDDGGGIAPEVLRERLRRPFGSQKPGGYGIGLYECNTFARELGGRLEIESEPGRGTEARLRLPLVPAAQDSRQGMRGG